MKYILPAFRILVLVIPLAIVGGLVKSCYDGWIPEVEAAQLKVTWHKHCQRATTAFRQSHFTIAAAEYDSTIIFAAQLNRGLNTRSDFLAYLIHKCVENRNAALDYYQKYGDSSSVIIRVNTPAEDWLNQPIGFW